MHPFRQADKPCTATTLPYSTMLTGQCVDVCTVPLFAQPFTTNSRVNDILTHSAFQGFAERLLPWDDNRYEPNLRLTQIKRLMPYYSHISPQVITETLNKMLTRAEQGNTIFYEIYSEVEKRH